MIKQDRKSSSAGFLRLRMMNEVVLMTSMMIAGMAFQAAISPPGGVWQDDNPPHKAGTAIMASRYPLAHKRFVEANKAAFVSSIVTIVLCAHGLRVTHAFNVAAMWLGFAFSVAFYTISFLISVLAISEGTGPSSWFDPALAVFLTFYAAHLHIAYVQPKLWPAVRRLVLDHPRVAETRTYIVTELSSLFHRRRSDAAAS